MGGTLAAPNLPSTESIKSCAEVYFIRARAASFRHVIGLFSVARTGNLLCARDSSPSALDKRNSMDKAHPLNLNLLKVISCLSGVLSPPELDRIREEIHRNVRQALNLGEGHLRAAKAARMANSRSWRQVVSRSYYGCYCASRAIRLSQSGGFSTEVEDHKRIGDLPDGFPDRTRWADILTKFRADRNLADYDHTAHLADLEYSAAQYLAHAERFIAAVRSHLHQQGII